MGWSDILYLAAIGFSVGLSVITTVVTRKKSKQVESREPSTENGEQVIVGDTENEKVSTENKKVSFWSELSQKLPQYIVAAETFYNQLVGKQSGLKTGTQKLAQVLDKVKIDCLTAGVEYDEQKATKMVNDLVDLTNSVNTNK